MLWKHTLDVAAPAEVFWQVTTEVTEWPSFVPTVQRLELLDAGPLRLGSRARIKQPAQPPTVWTVTRLEPLGEFAWQARRLGMIMTGAHLLEPLPQGCRSMLTLELAGPGSTVLGALIGRQVRAALDAENHALAAAAQDRARHP